MDWTLQYEGPTARRFQGDGLLLGSDSLKQRPEEIERKSARAKGGGVGVRPSSSVHEARRPARDATWSVLRVCPRCKTVTW